MTLSFHFLGVVPVLVGPLQVLLALLPAIAVSIGMMLLALFRPSALKVMARLLWQMKFAVLVIVFLIVGAVYLWAYIFEPEAGSPPSAARYDWPMFRGGPGRLGAVPASTGPAKGGINWSFSQGEKTFFSSPAIVGNRLYIASAKPGVLGQGTGNIYCLDADSGALVWKKKPKGYRPTFSSPAVHISNKRKYLVIGEGLHVTTDGRVICLDITDENDVKVLWQYRAADHVESSPCISDGRVYVGAGQDGFYCFELEPDEKGGPKKVWHVSGEKYRDCEASPVVYEGRVYVGLGVGGNAVCCLDAKTGRELWRLKTPQPVLAGPAIAGGKLFVGMGKGNFSQTDQQLLRKENEKRDSAGGEIWGIDLANPNNHWTVKLPDPVMGSVVATQEGLYVATRGGELYHISHSGKILASWDAHCSILASPACTDEYVYVMTTSGTLYGLDRDELKPKWEIQIPGNNQHPFISSPTVARGHIYAGTESGGVVCIGKPDDDKEAVIWKGHLGGAAAGGKVDKSPLPQDPAKQWPKRRPALSDIVTAPAAAQEDALYVPVAGANRTGLACLDNVSDNKLTQRWFYPTSNEIAFSPAAGNGMVFFVDGEAQSVQRHLYCIDAKTGEKLWQSAISSAASGEFTLLGKGICIENKMGTLAYLDLTGNVIWQRKLGPMLNAGASSGSILTVYLKSNNAIAALDMESGKTLWKAKINVAATTAPAIKDKTVFIGTSQGIQAYSLIDGELKWRSRDGAVQSQFTLSNSAIAYINDLSELIIIDILNGKRVAEPAEKLPTAIKSIPPMIVGSTVLYATDQDLVLADIEDGSWYYWMDISWLGTWTSPMIMSRSRLYFGTDKYGLICIGQWQ